MNSLMFWDDPVARLEELRGILRPGGRIAIAYQPRGPNASDETAAQSGRELATQFGAAGLTDVRLETLELEPANAVCVLGVRPR